MSVPRRFPCGMAMLTMAAMVWAVPAWTRQTNAPSPSSAANRGERTSLVDAIDELPAVETVWVTAGFDLVSQVVASSATSAPPAAPAGAKPGQETANSGGEAESEAELRRVIALMDRAASNFDTAQAKFVWTQYTSVVNETDVQKGTVYFRRVGRQVEMAADVTEPTPKQVVFADGKVQLYQPKINQYAQYDTGSHQDLVESFLVLGFGGSGQDMLKSFTVSYLGRATMDGVAVAKLDLVPKSEKVRNTFEHIELWIDLARGVSLEQKLFAQDNDYRLASYSDIRLHEKIPDSAFKLKNGKQSVLPQDRTLSEASRSQASR